MASPVVPYLPSAETQRLVIEYCKQTRELTKMLNLHNKLEYIDREFYRESNLETESQKAKIANMTGKKRKIQDITVPLVESQVETAVSFLTSVFLTGEPIFGVVSPPQLIELKKKYEAIIAENATRGGWAAELIMFFRDGEKYNFHALELDWKREKVFTPVETVNPGKQNSTTVKDETWAGNCLRRRDPYNLLFDIRCLPHEMHKKGEFAGYHELYSRIALKMFIEDLPYNTNVTEAFNSSFDEELYYIPQINPFDNYTKQKLQGAMNWDAWAAGGRAVGSKGINYKNLYTVTTRYIRLIPKEFRMVVPKPGTPQIWKVLTVNDKVVIYMERQSNAHNYLPIVCGQPYNDGLGLQTKGMGEKLIPLQDLASAAWNARLAGQRRKISDRGLYDPSRISSTDVNSDNPSAKIPVKPSVYGKSVADAYHQIPFEDNQTGSYIQDAKEFVGFANQVSGQNPAQQGQFVKGNKTLQEYEDVQEKSSGRQRTKAIFIENQVFTPIKEMIKLNILQYQPDGELTNPIDGARYKVNKEELRKAALAFRISDGLLPSDKMIPINILEVALQVVGSSPQLQQRYNLGGLFSYLMSLRGADLSPFELNADQMANARAIATGQTAVNAAAEAAGTAAGTQVVPTPVV